MNENKKTSAKVVAAALSKKGNRRGNRPRLSQYPGLQVQRHMRTTGPKTYYYHRTTGTRIEGEPGTAEFEANWAIAQAKTPKVFHKLKWKRRKSRKDALNAQRKEAHKCYSPKKKRRSGGVRLRG
jgi:hypothetical protein